MNATDEQFRLDLAQALDASAHDIAPLDTAALVGAGARRVRQRRLAGGAAAMVGVLALGGGTWALVNGPERPQVAAPAPTVSPAESSTVPAPSSAELAVNDTYGVTHHFVVRFTPTDPEPIAWYRVVDGREQLLATSAMPATGQARVLTGSDAPDVVVGVVPDEATHVALLAGGEFRGMAGSEEGTPLPGSGLDAVVWMVAPEHDTPDLFPLWYRADGTPVSDQGPGHVLRITQGVPEQVTVWTLPRDGLVGVDMIARTPFGAGDDRFSILNAYLAQTMDDTSPYTGRLNTVVLFEGTVTDVVPRYSTGGLANESVHVQAWPEEGKTVLVATADVPKELYDPSVDGSGPSLTGFTWVDADGVAQEWTP